MSDLCACLHKSFGALVRHRFSFDIGMLPRNGIYILFERGEAGHETDRIVRVGTHTGNGKLPSRLREHFLNENKDRSIFRKNIGRALLNREGNPLLAQWEIDLTTREARERHGASIDRIAQKEIEQRMTSYIQSAFTFAVIEVAEKERRLYLESAFVSAISLCEECRPSPSWLGLSCPKNKICESGLWQVNELYKQPLTPTERHEIEHAIAL